MAIRVRVRVGIEGGVQDEVITADKLREGEIGIVISSRAGQYCPVEPGDVAVGTRDSSVIFPRHWAHCVAGKEFNVRRRRPGEEIVIGSGGEKIRWVRAVENDVEITGDDLCTGEFAITLEPCEARRIFGVCKDGRPGRDRRHVCGKRGVDRLDGGHGL
jgi:hypothetical protein